MHLRLLMKIISVFNLTTICLCGLANFFLINADVSNNNNYTAPTNSTEINFAASDNQANINFQNVMSNGPTSFSVELPSGAKGASLDNSLFDASVVGMAS